MSRHPTEADPRTRDSVVYWFVRLDMARERNDFATAAQATNELKRLGVKVTYARRKAVAS